ncbi:MAG: hypothetical protein SNJ29_03355 [Rikenellaceae bacterium]
MKKREETTKNQGIQRFQGIQGIRKTKGGKRKPAPSPIWGKII